MFFRHNAIAYHNTIKYSLKINFICARGPKHLCQYCPTTIALLQWSENKLFNITEVCLNAIWDLFSHLRETIQTISESSGKII